MQLEMAYVLVVRLAVDSPIEAKYLLHKDDSKREHNKWSENPVEHKS